MHTKSGVQDTGVRKRAAERGKGEDMLKRPTAEAVCGKQKCEMIIAVEEVIVFFLTQRKWE